MKRNLLAGLILALAVPATALAADATSSARAKKHPVVAQAGAPSAKSDAGGASKTKKKGKATKAKTSKAAKNAADKASQAK